jgi:hypothetical protein
MYADNDYKFVAVLNERIDLPKLLNALGHMTAGLVAQAPNPGAMRFLRYEDANGGAHPAISHYPFIVLAARNGNQIRTLRQAAIEAGIIYNDFVDTMLGTSAEDQLMKTRATKEMDLQYYGICLFGPADLLNGMTRKFSLFRGGPS